MTEYWVDIKHYEGLYKISNLGRIKSLAKEWVCGKNSKRIKQETFISICTTTEYYNIRLHKKGLKSKYYTIHRLLAEHFIPNPQNKAEVNHINGDKHDNRLENLEWATSAENRQHAFDNGLKVASKGAKHYRATPIMVISLKENKTISFPCIKDASFKTGIGETSIWSNLRGRSKSWNYKFEYL